MGNGSGVKHGRNGVLLDPLGTLHPLHQPEHTLQMHNVSYIRSFTTGRWYSKLFNPPITAQFLKDVNMEVHAGETMCVCGSSGSGKTTLLNVIARRVQGTTAGRVLLNARPISERAFQHVCAYVSFKQQLYSRLTVEQTLVYQARLTLASALSYKEKAERVMQIMHDFELIEHSSRSVCSLSEPVRRRLLVAMHLIRDPVLILIDEPNRDMDSLSSYQLLYNIVAYTRRYNRMAIVSTGWPRSDLYQLFDRITLLFFGEVVYSGYTKHMPVYFRQIGYPCPASENPAIYYLSLATVDRETSERYMETQEQAVKLIEIFKGQGEPFAAPPMSRSAIVHTRGTLPLSHLGRPSTVGRLLTLTRRTMHLYMTSACAPLLARTLCLPALFALLLLFYGPYTRWTHAGAPQTRAGLNFNMMAISALTAPFVTVITAGLHRRRYYQESFDGMYGGLTFILSQIWANFLLDIVAVCGACALVYWPANLSTPLPPSAPPSAILTYLYLCAVIYTIYGTSVMATMSAMVIVRGEHTTAALVSVGNVLALVLAAAGVKSYTTFSPSTDWLHYFTYASIYRYAGQVLNPLFVNANLTTADCPGRPVGVSNPGIGQPPITYCRWDSGDMYLQEVYPPSMLAVDQQLVNFGTCFAFLAGTALFTILLYGVPLPHFIKRKFRYK